MLNKKQLGFKILTRLFVLLLLHMLIINNALSQNLKPGEKIYEEKGIQHFNNDEFTKALFYFNKLLELYPKDANYSYYTGVSLVEKQTQIEEAIYRLKIASLKDVPENVFFYLGKASHFNEKYNDAIKYYERYLSVGKKGEIEKLQVERLLKMCRAEVNPDVEQPEFEKITGKSDQVTVKTGQKPEKDEEKKESVAEKKSSSDYDELVEKALTWQIKADSVRRRSNESRQSLTGIRDKGEREKVKKNILKYEEESYNYQQTADSLYAIVKDMEQELERTPDSVLSDSEGDNQIIKDQQFLDHVGKVVPNKELKSSDDFYYDDYYLRFFSPQDYRTLKKAEGFLIDGDDSMEDVSTYQKGIEQEKLRISSETNKRKRRKSEKRISKLEDEIRREVIYASKFYQEGNATKYLVFKNTLENWNAANVKENEQKRVLELVNNAENDMDKAVELTKQGRNSSDTQKKFDLLLEANTYELMALKSQKKAFDIYAGEIPVGSKKNLSLIEDESEKPLEEDPGKDNEDVAVTSAEKEKDEFTGKKKTQPVDNEAKTRKKESKTPGTGTFAYDFQILEKSPYSKTNPFPADKNLPVNLVYKIQVAAFRKQVNYSYFKGLVPITTEKVINTNITRYFAGLFRTYKAARGVLDDVRKYGFSDAFIVSHYNGKKISLARAKKIEEID